MVRRGFTTAMSNLIFFIGALIAVSLAVSAMGYMLKQLQNAIEARTEAEALQTNTILGYIDGGYDGNYLWVYIRNIGKTNLDVNLFAVTVDNVLIGRCNDVERNVFCTDESEDYTLVPNEIMEVNIYYPGASSGAHRIRVSSQHASWAEGEVVVP